MTPGCSARSPVPLPAAALPVRTPDPPHPQARELKPDDEGWYLIAEEDRMINPATQKFMAERMNATTRTHAADDAPLITAPDVVTAPLTEAATTATIPGRSPA